MADDVTNLARFTPRRASRDGLLFAAGRASAPSRRPWQAATALLCVTQVVTVGLWQSPTRPAPPPTPSEPPAVVPAPAEWQPPPPSSYLALRARLGEPWRAAVSDSEPPPAGEPFGVRSSLD